MKSVKRIKLSVTDDSEQLYLSAFINELSIRPGELYPEKNSFGFNDLTLSDSRLTIVDSSGKKGASHVPATTGRETGSLLLALKELKLRNVFFDYHIPLNSRSVCRFLSSMRDRTMKSDLSSSASRSMLEKE